MIPAIFLDRDGVLNENLPDYVRNWNEMVVFEAALTALTGVRNSGYKVVVVTNQSGIGRGLIPLKTAYLINERLVELVRVAGGRIDAVYICPHTPLDNCACRKPKPGMLQQAAADLAIDLSQSIMIGDALTDIQAGRAAGVAQTALVRTGRGKAQLQLPEAAALQPLLVYDDVAQALANLLINGNLSQ